MLNDKEQLLFKVVELHWDAFNTWKEYYVERIDSVILLGPLKEGWQHK